MGAVQSAFAAAADALSSLYCRYTLKRDQHEVRGDREDAGGDDRVELVHEALQRGVLVEQLPRRQPLAGVAEREAPGQRAGGTCRRGNFARFMRANARPGSGDERADHRQHAREQDDDLAVAVEPAIAELELVLRDEEQATVALDGRATALGADPVRDLAPEVASERARDGGEHQIEGGDVDAVPHLQGGRDGGVRHRPRVRHDQLTGERDARALDGHKNRHPEVGQRGHHVDTVPAQIPDDLLNHASPRLTRSSGHGQAAGGGRIGGGRRPLPGRGRQRLLVPRGPLQCSPFGGCCVRRSPSGSEASSSSPCSGSSSLMSTAVMLSSPPRSLAR